MNRVYDLKFEYTPIHQGALSLIDEQLLDFLLRKLYYEGNDGTITWMLEYGGVTTEQAASIILESIIYTIPLKRFIFNNQFTEFSLN